MPWSLAVQQIILIFGMNRSSSVLFKKVLHDFLFKKVLARAVTWFSVEIDNKPIQKHLSFKASSTRDKLSSM